MAKRYFIVFIFFLLSTQLKAQQYGLFNTKTLFDAFENPAQKAFVLDSSRQYASNFLLPYFGLNAASKGDSQFVLNGLIDNGIYDSNNVPIGNNDRNKAIQSSNIYLFNFRLFKSYKFHKELGFSWQMRSDAYVDYTNETLVIFDDYNRFNSAQNGVFNGNGYGQSYHQFSFNYRENYNKRLAFGVKVSLLSGITYNKIDISQSSLNIDEASNSLSVGLTGNYQSNYLRAKELSSKTLLPNFKNPGLAVGFGTTYTSKSGVFIMGSIKDLGFIKWNNKSHSIFVDDVVTVTRDPLGDNNDLNSSNTLSEKVENLFIDSDVRKGFYSATNAKADFLISRKFGNYTPNLIVSKNLFYKGGDVAFVNTVKFNEFAASVTPAYNLIGFPMLGMQGMYQTPNFEFFLGTDNLLKSATIKNKATISNGYYGGSVYLGLAIKFGYVVEHPQNSSYMPGVGDDNEKSFLSKVFGVFKKKK
jgi:hypothetical protein